MTQAERDAMVYAHNAVRAMVTPYAVPPLGAMTWNGSLEASAQAWANGCNGYDHSMTPGVGENIAVSTSSAIPVPRPTPNDVVVGWDSERAFYNYGANSCSLACGHYTQVMWRTSVSVGCGVTLCDSSTSPFGPPFDQYDWYLVVCHYSPPGNFNGQWPYGCDYDSNPGTAETLCTAPPVGLYRDGFEVGAERWSVKSP